MRDALEKISHVSDSLLEPEMALSIVEDATDAIVIVRNDATIFFLNKQAEFLFGYHRSELYDKPIHMLVPEEIRERHSNHVATFLAEPRIRPMGLGMSLKGLRKDGSTFEAEINLSPLVVRQGLFVVAAVRKKRA